jgi:hypothetical protein
MDRESDSPATVGAERGSVFCAGLAADGGLRDNQGAGRGAGKKPGNKSR